MANLSILDDAMQSIGNTPMVKLKHVTKGIDATIAVKLEYCNPTASIKDRCAAWIVKEAEERGDIIPGKSVLIEGTSGNTGIALAALSAIKGYKCILVMPSRMSIERRAVITAYGALIVLTDPADGFEGVDERVNRLAEIITNSYKTNQHRNPSNPNSHYKTTGPEIWEQTNGSVDMIVFGFGTGGTLTGVGRFLKEKKSEVGVYGVEPFESSIVNGFPKGVHNIQGIGTGIIPDNLDLSIVNEVLRVKTDDAIEMAHRLATEEGIMAGISSGANVSAAIKLAQRAENKGKTIVTTVNDYGERYLSTALYDSIRSDVAERSFEDLETSKRAVAEYLKK